LPHPFKVCENSICCLGPKEFQPITVGKQKQCEHGSSGGVISLGAEKGLNS